MGWMNGWREQEVEEEGGQEDQGEDSIDKAEFGKGNWK